MADIWQQFHSLPKAIRDGVSTPQAIHAVDELEAQYKGADLANLIMRTVVHEFPYLELKDRVVAECNVDGMAAQRIVDRLTKDIFFGDIADYLGIGKPAEKTEILAIPSVVPVIREAPSSPPMPPINLPLGQYTDSATPAVPKVPPSMVRSSVPVPKTTADLDPKHELPAPSQTGPTSAPVKPIGPIAPTSQYSDEDAKEIEDQVSRIKQLAQINPNQDFDSIARRVLTEQNLAYGDELMDRRSVAIVKARLKGVRTTDETKDILMRDVKIGGLGLDQEIAVNVAAVAEKYAVELKARGMVREPESLPPVPSVPVPKVSQEKPQAMPPFKREGVAPTPVIPTNIIDAPRPSRPIIRPKDIPAPPVLSNPAISKPRPKPVVTGQLTQPVVQRARGVDRPTTMDVSRPVSRSLGPAEEMRSMTLIEFRRLGQGAGDAAQRLLDKFKHLQKESFAVWAESVAGWRQSDVYQLYLSIGRESMEKAVPISQIIADRTRLGQPYLSDHEFSVLADLNRHLQN